MELDVNIVINQYKSELTKIYLEKVSLQCQVVQLQKNNQELKEKIMTLEEEARIKGLREVIERAED